MSRLRQKYKKLKKKNDALKGMLNSFYCTKGVRNVETCYPVNLKCVKEIDPYHLNDIYNKELFIKAVDKEAYSDFINKLIEYCLISREEKTEGDTTRFEYTLTVIPPKRR